MSTDFIFRIIGMVVFAVIGVYTGIYLGGDSSEMQQAYGTIISLLGALIGLVLTPLFGISIISQNTFSLPAMLVAWMGAVILVGVVSFFRWRKEGHLR